MLSLALLVALQAPLAPTPIGAPPPAPAAAARAEDAVVIALDNRIVKDQAPGAFLTRTVAALEKLRGVRVLRISDGRKRLDARGDKELSRCADDAGCLATAAREIGADIVVTVRLTRRTGAYFLALTRISALRPQMSDDAATLAGSEQDALKFVADAVAELFPDTEEKAP